MANRSFHAPGLLSTLREGKLHFPGTVDDMGGVENLKAHDATVLREVGDDSRADLVTLTDLRFTERDRQDVSLDVVFDLHGFRVRGIL